MKCPNNKCNKEGCKYIERKEVKTQNKRTIPKRTNFKAVCKYCGWVGEI